MSPEEALRTVLTVAQRLPPVTVPLHEALGKVLAEDVRAPDPLPPYPASIKVFQNFDFTFAPSFFCFIVALVLVILIEQSPVVASVLMFM